MHVLGENCQVISTVNRDCIVAATDRFVVLYGDAENARHENAGLENAAQICRGWKMRDWKMWHKNAGRENAGLEKAGKENYGTPYVK